MPKSDAKQQKKAQKANHFGQQLNQALDNRKFRKHNRSNMLAKSLASDHEHGIDLTPSAVAHWLRGEVMPPAKRRQKLANHLMTDVEWLCQALGEAEPPEYAQRYLAKQTESALTKAPPSVPVPVYQLKDLNKHPLDFLTQVTVVGYVECHRHTTQDEILFAFVLDTVDSPLFPIGTVFICKQFISSHELKDGNRILVQSKDSDAPHIGQLRQIHHPTNFILLPLDTTQEATPLPFDSVHDQVIGIIVQYSYTVNFPN